jgi:hypothetical protein
VLWHEVGFLQGEFEVNGISRHMAGDACWWSPGGRPE